MDMIVCAHEWTMKCEFHVTFTLQNILLILSNHLKNTNTVLSSQAVQKQVAGGFGL